MKKIKLTALFLIGLSALLFVIALIINTSAFDEELLPEVLAIKNIKAKPFSNNNALPALLAINGAAETSLSDSKDTIRKFLNNKIQQTGLDYLNDAEYAELIGVSHAVDWKSKYKFCTTRSDALCMQHMFTAVKNRPVNDPQLILQLRKYQELISMSEFGDFTQLDYYAPFPAYGLTLDLKKLFIADAYLNDEKGVFIDKLKLDMQFWKMMINNSHLLLTKMVAVASFYDGLNSISTAIKANHFNSQQLLQIQAFTEPLSQSEFDMEKVFEFEFKYGIDMVQKMDQEGNIDEFAGFDFFQPNATHNYNYINVTRPLLKLTKLDAKVFHQYMRSEQATMDFQPPSFWTPGAIYNPVGKILIGYALPAYTDYFGRMHDLNGMIHLLNLHIELVLNSELPTQQVIKHSKWVNPYTLEPMSYDPESKRIYFDCMDKTSSCELLL